MLNKKGTLYKSAPVLLFIFTEHPVRGENHTYTKNKSYFFYKIAFVITLSLLALLTALLCSYEVTNFAEREILIQLSCLFRNPKFIF